MKNILILGGGFVGSNIANNLILNGHTVKILSRTNPNIEKANFVEIEWLEIQEYEKEFDYIDIVIHTISTSVPFTSNLDILKDVEENIIANIKCLNILIKKNIQKLIYISSGGAIYGEPKSSLINEAHATNPISSYGITKLTTEKYLHLYKIIHGLNSIILRPSNLYGIGQSVHKPQGIIGHILDCIKSNKPFTIWGDGKGRKDYLHISDFVTAINQVINFDQDNFSFLNIGSGESYSIMEIIAIFKEVTNIEVALNFQKQKNFDVSNISIDSTQFNDSYNWRPKFTLRMGIKELINSKE